MVLGALAWCVASGVQTAMAQQDNPPPAPAYGVPNATVMTDENPPIFAVDSASLEPNLKPRSMLVGGVGSESLDTNVDNPLTNSSSVHSVTRLLGGLTMQRLWSRYGFAAAYVGGVGFYSNANPTVRNIQEFQAQQSVSWKTGQFTVRDSFSYLPEGTFGAGASGGASGFHIGLGGLRG